MYSLDAIEAINSDQIATATDRILFGTARKRSPAKRPSSPELDLERERERDRDLDLDHDPEREAVTVFVRHEAPVASTVRAALFGAAAGLLVASFGIALVSLLA
jgi:hypothetical protein